MPVSQAGSINTTALIVPDIYVQILPPQNTLINGLPTNILGIVGTAQWGPVNAPTTIGDMTGYAQTFGAVQNRKYDMGTQVALAVLQGANNFKCVRVTDGTDVAASGTLTASSASDAAAIVAAINQGQSGLRGPSGFVIASSTGSTVTITSKYTGTLGNSIVAKIGAGSKNSTTSVVISMPNRQPETFDNIGAASATAGSATLSGGTDGATTITSSVMLGQDTIPRKGMYALRNTYTSIALLADCDDSTSWTTQVAFGLFEGIYMIGVGPAGDTIANAVSAKATAGIDSYAMKLLFGDWVYWTDSVNNVTRLVSPQGFVAGCLANLSPEQSSLNKQLFGIVGTQKSMQNLQYSSAELQTLAQAGIDLITNPIPAGSMFGVRIGHNTSSNPVINGDNYTRMTNYLAFTLNSAMGKFVGRVQSTSQNDPLRRQVDGTISSFMQTLIDQGMLDSFDNKCDLTNNPPNRIALGYLQDDLNARYLGIAEKLIVNMQAGQSVVTRASLAASA